MQFKEFLTEVSTGDILAFNQAVRRGDFHPDKYVGREYGEPNAYEEINEFFEKRGYKRIGSGAFSTVLQSKDHYVVKVASQDVAFSSYADLTRSGRMNSLFPRIIAVTNVPLSPHHGSDEAVKVYFVERLFPLQTITAEELIKHHTAQDAPMFLWLVAGFVGHPLEAEKMRTTAMTLNPELSIDSVPKHPGWKDEKKASQYYTNLTVYQNKAKELAERAGGDHPFFTAISQIMEIRDDHILDLHSHNVMVRKPGYDIVITDPVA